MSTVSIQSRYSSYQIIIASAAIQELRSFCLEKNIGKLFIVSNQKIWSLHGQILIALLNDIDYALHLLPDSEDAKSYSELERVHRAMLENDCDRSSYLLAFGGGIVGDLAGFAAASYMRGIPFIQIPTTLLAQVDSSVGGKVAINHPMGKNLVGAFYPPSLVLIDPQFLKTLAKEELICGLGEILKYAYIRSAEFLTDLKQNWKKILDVDELFLHKTIETCIQIKRDIVNRDEFETGERAILNFGHSFAHALEAYNQFTGIKHGEAVLTGMIAALYLSCKEHPQSSIDFREEKKFIQKLFSYPHSKLDIEALLALMKHDKKNTNGRLQLILLKDIAVAKKKAYENDTLLREAFRQIISE